MKDKNISKMKEYPIVDKEYLVYVRCLTYNQANYIEDMLHGVAMQSTNFPYVLGIEEDCSTDETASKIQSYIERECDTASIERYEMETANVIKARHRTNVNCTMVAYLFKFNHFSKHITRAPYTTPWRSVCKYECWCEGDDYWIDPLKLQKQVGVMDSNPEYMMCGTNALVLWEKNVEQPNYFNSVVDSRELTPKEILNNWWIPSPALFFRERVLDEFNKWIVPLPFGDIPLIFTALNLGKIYCLSDVTCVYRKLYGGSIVYNAGRKSGNLPYQLAIRACYEEFDKYSAGKFHDIIAEKLKSVNNKIHFLELKKKSKALAAIMHPQITWRLISGVLMPSIKKYQIKNKRIG